MCYYGNNTGTVAATGTITPRTATQDNPICAKRSHGHYTYSYRATGNVEGPATAAVLRISVERTLPQ